MKSVNPLNPVSLWLDVDEQAQPAAVATGCCEPPLLGNGHRPCTNLCGWIGATARTKTKPRNSFRPGSKWRGSGKDEQVRLKQQLPSSLFSPDGPTTSYDALSPSREEPRAMADDSIYFK